MQYASADITRCLPHRWIAIALLLGLLIQECRLLIAFAPPSVLTVSRPSLWSESPVNSRRTSFSSYTKLSMSDNKNIDMSTQLKTFRDAEVLGLKFMQERKFEEALKAFQKGMTLPGSKSDIVRTRSLSGPSPVGGSTGGFESKNTLTLDEFELQAANYNMACAQAQLGKIDEAIDALRNAFENGFDNYATVRGDPDLDPVKGTKEFEKLMESFEPKKGFNPFGMFGKK